MNPVDQLTLAIVVTALIMIFTYWKTITSQQIPKEKKIVIYVITVLIPILGLILFFVFKNNKGKAVTAS
jgi:hypothetical protein